MKLSTRYLLYVAALHLALAALVFRSLRTDLPLFIGAELLLVGSLLAGWQLYRRLRQPAQFLASGVEAMRDNDFTVTFVETGHLEVDQLIRMYNLMISQLRLERTRQAEQQFFLDKLVDAAPIALLIFDFDGRITTANPMASRLLGCPVSTLLGRSLAELTHPLLNQLEGLPPDQPHTIRLNGVETYRVLRGQFIDRGFRRQFLFLEEMTAEVIATEKNAYGHVIRVMAHEVNNSIGAVNTILSLAEPELPDTELRSAVRVAIDRNGRLNRFMGRFADVVRLPLPAPVATDMATLLSALSQLMQPQATQLGIGLTLQLPTEPVIWRVDVGQLEQVLVNVIRNAFDACEPGQSVELRLDARQLRIRNNGQPIDAAVASRLFNPFFSTRATGQGIGLTLTRDILRNHGFSFSLQTGVDGWTTFTIDYP
ncbi:ATP-binding protein [Spirosoma luteolum]